MQAKLTLETKRFSPHEFRIVRGTYDAMARIGTQQLSLRRIAKELDVSPTLLVYHFGTRDKLLLETIHWALGATVRRIQRSIADIEDPEAALAALMDAVFVGARENRDFHLIYMDLVSYAVRHDSFTALADLLREHIDGSYAAIIQQGVEAGNYDADDIALAARQARAIVEGGFVQWIQDANWESTHAALKRDCHDALLRLLAPRPRAARRPRKAQANGARPRRSGR
jgi:AcrR family transcriptional regulator